MHDEFQLDRRRIIVPAWLLSIGVHVVVLICISFFAVGTGDSSLTEETSRPVGIVLARKSENHDRKYFDETSEDTPESDSSAVANADAHLPQPSLSATQPKELGCKTGATSWPVLQQQREASTVTSMLTGGVSDLAPQYGKHS